MNRFVIPFSLLTLLVIGPASLRAADAEPPAPIGTQIADLPGVKVVERVIEGGLVASAVLPGSLGRGLAVLLVRGEVADDDEKDGTTIVIGSDGTEVEDAEDDSEDEKADERLRELWAVFADPELPPRLLAGDVPAKVNDVELHRDGSAGSEELWLGGDGVIYRLDAEAATATAILAAPGLDLGALEQTGLLNIGGGVAIPELGRLRLLDAQLHETALVPLPVTAQRRASGLILSSPHVVRPRAHGMPFFVGPEAQGATRLLVRVLDPAAPEGESAEQDESEPTEAWIRLPGPEDVERSKYIVLDGIPRLAITTTNAEKLGIFEELAFRLYGLRPDRTRGGAGPLLKAQTETKNWFTVGVEVADLNLDGKDDLALLQPEGLGGGDLIVDVFLGFGEGRPGIGGKRHSKIDGGGEFHWGDDFTGDGVPDLFLASSERVGLWAGEKDHRTRAVEKKATWGWKPAELSAAMHRVDGENGPTPSGYYSRLGRLRAHDLDGDGDMDLSLVKGQHGRVVVRFVLPKS